MPIRIDFYPGGNVTTSPTGYAGPACHEATKPYDDALRATTARSTPTAEASQHVVIPTTQQQQEYQ